MMLDCEKAMKLIIPAARIAVSNELSKRHKMVQSEIAKRLGVEQAAVSKYLAHRYSKRLARLEGILKRSGRIAGITSIAASGKSINDSIDRLAADSHLVRAALRLQ